MTRIGARPGIAGRSAGARAICRVAVAATVAVLVAAMTTPAAGAPSSARAGAAPIAAAGLRHVTISFGMTLVRPLAVGPGGVWVVSGPRNNLGGKNLARRIDLQSNRPGPGIALPENTEDVAVGAGALWALHYTGRHNGAFSDPEIVRLDPASGARVGAPVAVPEPFRTVPNSPLCAPAE